MNPLTADAIRASFLNVSQRERKAIPLPDLDAVEWDKLDYLGWRDPKAAKRAYVIVPFDDGAVGILLRQAEASPRSRAQCSWCQDVQLPNDVAFYSARRAGAEGRKGDTVGTLVCADFECSANVRRAPVVAYVGFDVDAARAERIAELRERAASFAFVVQHGT